MEVEDHGVGDFEARSQLGGCTKEHLLQLEVGGHTTDVTVVRHYDNRTRNVQAASPCPTCHLCVFPFENYKNNSNLDKQISAFGSYSNVRFTITRDSNKTSISKPQNVPSVSTVKNNLFQGVKRNIMH